MPRSRGDPQLRIELAGAVERDHLVAAADMLAIDEDLRDGAAAMRALDHLGPPPRLLIEADLGEIDALLLQQRAGPGAVGAPPRRIHLDSRHPRPAPKTSRFSVGHIWRVRSNRAKRDCRSLVNLPRPPAPPPAFASRSARPSCRLP